eukprot:3041595-Pyramimonas_sp.AAC.1
MSLCIRAVLNSVWLVPGVSFALPSTNIAEWGPRSTADEGSCRGPQSAAAPTAEPGGPIRHRKHRYTLTADQSDAESTGTFSRRTNQTQEAQ